MTKAPIPRRTRRVAPKIIEGLEEALNHARGESRGESPADPPAALDLEEPPAVALARLQHELMIASQQRDFLSRQVDSLVQRVAGLHVAHGTMVMAAAQGFVQKEILPINQVLQQIAAQPRP